LKKKTFHIAYSQPAVRSISRVVIRASLVIFSDI
jgi:hypothetical protein